MRDTSVGAVLSSTRGWTISGAGLGMVPRPYEMTAPKRIRDGLHMEAMTPNVNDELLVQAHCRHHYVMQSRKDLRAGKLARCTTEGCRWR